MRYTEIASGDSLVSTTQTTMTSLEQNGYVTTKVKNTWCDETNPYKGINTQMVSPNGQAFEVQYHTPESFALKWEGKMSDSRAVQ